MVGLVVLAGRMLLQAEEATLITDNLVVSNAAVIRGSVSLEGSAANRLMTNANADQLDGYHATNFATAVQGGKADRAVQTNHTGNVRITGSLGVGQWAVVTGAYAHAEGSDTLAGGDYSHAEGAGSVAYGAGAHAEGNGTRAADYSHAEGHGTYAGGAYAHAEGQFTTAQVNHAHAEGFRTKASGGISHAEGGRTVAAGEMSHAGGSNTLALGRCSYAIGTMAQASNHYSYVWSDGMPIASTTTQQYTVYAANGIRLLGGMISGNGAGLSNITAAQVGAAASNDARLAQLASAAYSNASAFATAAQGVKADTALQPEAATNFYPLGSNPSNYVSASLELPMAATDIPMGIYTNR